MVAISPDESRVADTVNHWLAMPPPVERHHPSRSRAVTDILFGSRRIRHGPAPSNRERDYMVMLVDRYISLGVPVQVTLLWGGAKAYGHFPHLCRADLADLLALRRFVHLNSQVHDIYPPGLHVNIIMEDWGEIALTLDPADMPDRIKSYIASLIPLATAASGREKLFHFEIESALFTAYSALVAYPLFREALLAATGMFQVYWNASAEVPEEDRAGLEAFALLKQIGWAGTLPNDSRGYYLERARRHYPDAPMTTLVTMVCEYLACAFLRTKYRILRGRVTDSNGEIPPVRASFVPYPKGAPEFMRLGRIEYKTKDSVNNKQVPPWLGFGCVDQVNFGLSVIPCSLGAVVGTSRVVPYRLHGIGGTVELAAPLCNIGD